MSTQEQGEGFSLDGQEADCRAYCERQGYRLRYLFREIGSGRDASREYLNRVLDLATARRFDVLILWRRDRLGRDVLHNALADRELREAGVRVEAVNTGRQAESDENHLMRTLLDAFAEFEAKRIASRCQMGRVTAARSGGWPLRAPFGYSKDGAGKLMLIEPEAVRVKEAYEACAQGSNRERLGLVLGCDGTTAMRRLRSPLYKGSGSYAGVPVSFPPIVAPELWDRAQKAIAARYQHPTKRNPAYTRREARRATDATAP